MTPERFKRAEKYWTKGRFLEDCLLDALERAEKGIAKFDFDIIPEMQSRIDELVKSVGSMNEINQVLGKRAKELESKNRELCIELGDADIEIKRLENELEAAKLCRNPTREF
jgi:tellurite resistance protein